MPTGTGRRRWALPTRRGLVALASGSEAGYHGANRRDVGSPEMQPTRRPRYTIGQIMAGIAVLASLLAIPQLINSPDRLVLFCSLGILATLVLLNAAIEAVFGKVCPACSRRALRRLARHRRYYRCLACRAQLKRFGLGRWLDASGPDDAARYRRPSEAGIWKGFDVPKDLKGSSSGVLLGSKRSRDLLGEIRQHPPKLESGRRLEEAGRKVRDFLKRRYQMED
jgi:hypothetical protein